MALFVLLVVGTIGYAALEGWSVADSAYMMAITISTVGYGEPQQLSPGGRLFTVLVIVLCLVFMSVWTATLTSFVVESDLRGRFLDRKLRKMIARSEKHTILCGLGMMARAALERLVTESRPVVIVDPDEEQLAQLRELYPQVLTVAGNPTDELTLADANILNASEIVAATDSDVDNLLIAITAQDIAEQIHVYARSESPAIATRMRKSGVDRVISPDWIGGNEVADAILVDEAAPDAFCPG